MAQSGHKVWTAFIFFPSLKLRKLNPKHHTGFYEESTALTGCMETVSSLHRSGAVKCRAFKKIRREHTSAVVAVQICVNVNSVNLKRYQKSVGSYTVQSFQETSF